MKAERFRQIRNLFDAAMEREPEARTGFLKEACQGDRDLLAEVARLLAAHGEPTAWTNEGVTGPAPERREGRRVGPYEILRQLGEGGMGTVYLAVRSDGVFRKQVALKIVRSQAPSHEVLERFQREREILAALDHPNIARILDGGTTDDGLPYLVMEYVEGQSIDSYCDERRLDIDDRLRLFRDVCAAVHYAHRQHVIHRDIKPANVLVSAAGTVKLLDFGIAKLAAAGPDAPTVTRTDLLAMTPEYASPEQINGDAITPMTDVYALGILLYELLTGHRPYRFKSRLFREIARVVCEEPPTRPSVVVGAKASADPNVAPAAVSRLRAAAHQELKRRLRGDLDSILLRALEKEPPRRYRSVAGFSEDLRRHVEHGRVEARGHAWMSAIGRFVARYQWWLLALVIIGLAIRAGILVLPPGFFGFPVVLLVSAAIGLILARRVREGAWVDRRGLIEVGQGIAVLAVVLIVSEHLRPASVPTGALIGDGVRIGSSGFIVFWGLRWLTRERRLGALVFDLSGRRIASLIVGGLFLLMACLQILYRHFFAEGPLFSIPALLGVVVLLNGLQEIRQRGIAAHGGLIPSRDILSYSWTTPRNDRAVLWLRTNTLLGLWGRAQIAIRMSQQDRPKVEALLERQLFEWPS